jgi:hypothetical protein
MPSKNKKNLSINTNTTAGQSRRPNSANHQSPAPQELPNGSPVAPTQPASNSAMQTDTPRAQRHQVHFDTATTPTATTTPAPVNPLSATSGNGTVTVQAIVPEYTGKKFEATDNLQNHLNRCASLVAGYGLNEKHLCKFFLQLLDEHMEEIARLNKINHRIHHRHLHPYLHILNNCFPYLPPHFHYFPLHVVVSKSMWSLVTYA